MILNLPYRIPIIPEVTGEDISMLVPAASQTTSHPAFGLRNIAISGLIRSRRASLSNSGPVPHFSE